jgi:hypothetical protein
MSLTSADVLPLVGADGPEPTAAAVALAAAVVSAVRLDGRLTGVTATSG